MKVKIKSKYAEEMTYACYQKRVRIRDFFSPLWEVGVVDLTDRSKHLARRNIITGEVQFTSLNKNIEGTGYYYAWGTYDKAYWRYFKQLTLFI